MASAFSHAIVAWAIGKAVPMRELTTPTLAVGMACSILPDLDVVGFHFGIQYGDLWGHRGLSHSILFAVVLSGVLVTLGYRKRTAAAKLVLFTYFFLSTASRPEASNPMEARCTASWPAARASLVKRV